MHLKIVLSKTFFLYLLCKTKYLDRRPKTSPTKGVEQICFVFNMLQKSLFHHFPQHHLIMNIQMLK